MRFVAGFISPLAFAAVAQAQGLYIEPFGGANWATNFSGASGGGDITLNASSDDGYVIGGKVGSPIDAIYGLRVEGELAYRRNNITGAWSYLVEEGPPCCIELAKTAIVEGDLVSIPFTGEQSTFSFMANAVYAVEAFKGVEPYVLGGAGYASRHMELSGDRGPNLDTDEGGFAWQFGAGVDFEVATGVKASLGYVYFVGPSIGRVVTVDGYNPVEFNSDGVNQSAVASVTFAF